MAAPSRTKRRRAPTTAAVQPRKSAPGAHGQRCSACSGRWCPAQWSPHRPTWTEPGPRPIRADHAGCRGRHRRSRVAGATADRPPPPVGALAAGVRAVASVTSSHETGAAKATQSPESRFHWRAGECVGAIYSAVKAYSANTRLAHSHETTVLDILQPDEKSKNGRL